jgi:hypothetical protein
LAKPGVGVSSAQSFVALSESVPFGSRASDTWSVFESLRGVAVPSTRLTGPGKPSICAIVIEPS